MPTNPTPTPAPTPPNPTRTVARALALAMTRQHEDLILFPYDDQDPKRHKSIVGPGYTVRGKVTIGWGRNLTDRGLSKAESDYLHANDLDVAAADLDMVFGWWRKLDAVRQAALWDMSYNMGITTLATFKTSMPLISQGRYDEAAYHLRRSRWYGQVGYRAERIVEMIRTGNPPRL